jgi:hypothetical protein
MPGQNPVNSSLTCQDSQTLDVRHSIHDYIKHNNRDLQPFVWAKSSADIILKLDRGRNALEMTPLKPKDSL